MVLVGLQLELNSVNFSWTHAWSCFVVAPGGGPFFLLVGSTTAWAAASGEAVAPPAWRRVRERATPMKAAPSAVRIRREAMLRR